MLRPPLCESSVGLRPPEDSQSDISSNQLNSTKSGKLFDCHKCDKW
jgi:hypothetical protein